MMAKQATVTPVTPTAEVDSDSKVGLIELAGRRADEIVRMLEEAGYHVEVKRLVPGAETVLALEVAYGVGPTLFDT